MNKVGRSEQKNNNFFYWRGKKIKLIHIIVATILSFVTFTVSFNLFLYNWVLTPISKKTILEVETGHLLVKKEYLQEIIKVYDQYESLKDSLKNQLREKEFEFNKVKIQYKELQYQVIEKSNQIKELQNRGNKNLEKIRQLQNLNYETKEKVTELEQRMYLKEEQIKFYEDKIDFMQSSLSKANKSIIRLKKLLEIDRDIISVPEKIVLYKILQSVSESISLDDVKNMIKQHDFFDYTLNRNANGFANKFELQIHNREEIVIDKATGLIWQKSGSLSRMNYSNAVDWIENLNRKKYAGKNDWRLPTLEEAMSLIEPVKTQNLYIDSIFDNRQTDIWTSSFLTGLKDKYQTWVVDFLNGSCKYAKDDNTLFVRAVRSE